MKHYRFRNIKDSKFKKPKFIMLVPLVLYSLVWLYMAYSTKQYIVQTIDYNNKNQKTFSVNYGDINMGGFPFAIKTEINDLKVSVDSSEMAGLIASTIEKPGNKFPPLKHKQVYSTVNEAVILNASLLQKEYTITIPKEIVLKHYFENQKPLNLVYKFKSSPSVLINENQAKNNSTAQRFLWLAKVADINLSLPSYQLRMLDGDNLMTQSQGLNLSVHAGGKRDDIGWNIKYQDLGTRYTDEIANLLDPLMQTAYFQQLAHTMPMQYEELGYAKKYTDAGEHKMNVNVLARLQSEGNDDLQIDLDLIRLDQSDDYGSLNGAGKMQLLFNPHTHEIKMDNQGYFAVSLEESWHKKWLSSIDRAFKNINVNKDIAALKDKLKMFLPRVHNYKYATLRYKFNYSGAGPFDSANMALDSLKVQTNEFAVTAQKSADLPLNFIIKIYNHPKILQIGKEYLQELIRAPGDAATYNQDSRELNDLALFLGEIRHKDSLCKRNWNGQLKLIKGQWYLGDYRLSAIQSIILSIALKG